MSVKRNYLLTLCVNKTKIDAKNRI